MNNFAKEDIDSKGIEFKLIDINAFYEEGDNCNIDKLKEKIDEIKPSFALISICFSETLDLRFALEMAGIFPELRLKGSLRMATQGKQIKLDPTQSDLLCTMAKEQNIQKTTILHGPEGSGKTILAMEVVKMKLSHYMKKLNLQARETMKKIRVVVCGSYTGEDRVPLLLKQLIEENKDIGSPHLLADMDLAKAWIRTRLL